LLKRQTKLGKDRSSISRTKSPKFEVQNRAKHTNIRPKHSVLAAISSLATNAALSGEQRLPPYLIHCAVTTKADSNRKYQAL
ncbi:hypothetical protein D5994_25610, partial [Vibrio parahaemolyticus]|nr:hypothetical protein [Vibrio parahaemolyticus]